MFAQVEAVAGSEIAPAQGSEVVVADPSYSSSSAELPSSTAEDPYQVEDTSSSSSSYLDSRLGQRASIVVVDIGAWQSGLPSAELGEALG